LRQFARHETRRRSYDDATVVRGATVVVPGAVDDQRRGCLRMGGAIVDVLAALGVLAALFWVGQLIEAIRFRARATWLSRLPTAPSGGRWPEVAVIFAARNEAIGVERATRSLLALEYPGLELIAVDDRSTDGTGAILDAIAAEDPRLNVVHVQDLPKGWLGKTHALHAAAMSTSARWLLFTDADVVFAPTALSRAIGHVERRGLDHLAVVPDVLTESAGERIFLAMFLLLFNAYAPPRKVSDRRSKVAAGIGAFNLVRAEAFRAIGGFRRLALSVDDDMRLGQALKYAGYRGDIALGLGMVAVRWQSGLGGMIRGLEKNFFAGAGYHLVIAVIAVLGILEIGVAPHVGVFLGPWWTRAICALGIASIALIFALMRRPGGVRWYHALVLPIGALACIVALLRSASLALHRGGIRWRNHHYPLEELRAHARARNGWIREVWRSTR
jgi:glycosyltransferase involved in cell wall biosynthesis